ncbi:tRNA (adenosine(37)-N6)-threonylcarbamoyltransferase complex ATPase subunit type 1 TsaE [Desulfurivibrio sp. D14AmB]|uniref:tRNA (adenosine(37)-N6)-threonylcarbamoyltransferase complex ATPase subunit type 1 TsaE n=1 Tax=Desulfurivibrio sp. D14AmB TaxID=3374370 RepID=UPI00376F2C57
MNDNWAPKLVLEPADLAGLNDLGRRLGELVIPGDVITLEGALGVGKTTLTQAIAAGMAVPADQFVTSPTFGIIHEHQGRLPLYHLDLYRLDGGEEELLELGIEEYLYGEGVCVIEWPGRLGGLIPNRRLEVALEFHGASGRRLTLIAFGSSWRSRLAGL